MITIEEELRLKQIESEAATLTADELREVIVKTWQLWLAERRLVEAMLEAEGIHCRMEVQGAHPLQLLEKSLSRPAVP
jgi:hypothetical protein